MSLKPAWIFQSGSMGFISAPATYAFDALPIIVDGVMFVSGWDGSPRRKPFHSGYIQY
jgi:alcohol dehydrogenase (cytochrome c)